MQHSNSDSETFSNREWFWSKLHPFTFPIFPDVNKITSISFQFILQVIKGEGNFFHLIESFIFLTYLELQIAFYILQIVCMSVGNHVWHFWLFCTSVQLFIKRIENNFGESFCKLKYICWDQHLVFLKQVLSVSDTCL